MKLELRFLSTLTLAASLGLTGCPADEDPAETGDGSTGDATTGVDGSGSTTADPSTSTTDPSGTTTSSTTSTSTTDGTSTTTDGTTTSTTTGEPVENGQPCMANEECISEMCFLAGILGGICGDCLTEADCEFGCNLPNPLSDPPTGSFCNDGQLGEGCETEASCVDEALFCSLIIDVPGILSASTCSECETTADCDAPQLCNVSVDIATISGQKTCVDVGSVPDGDFCDLEGDGDEACMRHCGEANIMGLVSFGVCGECRNVDGVPEGCAAMQDCVDPMVDLDGNVVASACVDQ